jgi:hypothetical protein
LAVVLTLLVAAGCGRGSGDPDDEAPIIFALLSDRSLLEVSSASGRILRTVQLGPRAPVAGSAGDFLARGPDGSTLFVLLHAATNQGQSVAEVATSTLKVGARHRLPAGISFQSLVVGPRSGRLYLAGNRLGKRAAGAPVLLVLEPGSGAVVERMTIRPTQGRDWLVLDAAVSSDERHAAVSYHGDDTTGADLISLAGQPRRCIDRTPDYAGCMSLHGGVVFGGHGLLAATGEGPLIELALDGRVLRRWRTRLPRNHLMALAVDGRGRVAATVGSCGYTGGVSVIELDSGRTTVIGYPRTVCGEIVAFAEAELLAVARNALPVPQGTPSAIEFVDVGKRRIVRRTPARTDVIALVAT